MNKETEIRKLAERLADHPEQEWDSRIREWCEGDEEMEQLLAIEAEHNIQARAFVESLQKQMFTLTKSSIRGTSAGPDSIAGYRIIRRLGSGSSATVYLARTEKGEKAALKILKAHLDDSVSRQRFMAEQRILSALKDPCIAGYINGGVTVDGQPFVLMEYAEGIPIDTWCDRRQLSVNERIRLFSSVCRAVHTAHQNLVVHRDLKPDHILVDETGAVKLIDFGIAKLLDPGLPENDVARTHTHMRMMTPEFASPEQIRGHQLTTASDVYSLGVLLYILLTGSRPYSLNSLSLLDIERTVCKSVPPKPATKFSAGDKSQAEEIARNRSTDPGKLRRILSGDPGRIIMMAMHKEPGKRYDSALSMADDLERWLRKEPVKARPPSFYYRCRKFTERNRWGVAATAAALLILIGGVGGILWQNQQTLRHAGEAQTQAMIAQQVTDFLVELFESADPSVALGEPVTTGELLKKGEEQALAGDQDPDIQLHLLTALGRVYQGMGMHQKSTDLFMAALEIAEKQPSPDRLHIARLQRKAGINLRVMGRLAESDSLHLLAYQHRRQILGDENRLTIQSFEEWAGVHAYYSRNTEKADSLFRKVVERRRVWASEDPAALGEALNNLAYINMLKRDFYEAQKNYRESAEMYRIGQDENHPDRLRALTGLAVAYHRGGDYSRSEQMYRDVINRRTAVLGPDHHQVGTSWYHLAEVLRDTGRNESALTALLESVRVMQQLDAPHQLYPSILLSLADVQERTQRLNEAGNTYRLAAAECAEIRGERSPGCLQMYQAAGRFFLETGYPKDGLEFLQRAYEGFHDLYGPEDDRLLRLEDMMAKAGGA